MAGRATSELRDDDDGNFKFETMHFVLSPLSLGTKPLLCKGRLLGVRRPGAALARGGLAPLRCATRVQKSRMLAVGPKRRRAAALQGDALYEEDLITCA